MFFTLELKIWKVWKLWVLYGWWGTSPLVPSVYILSSIQSIKNQPCSMFIPWFVDLSMFANLYATSIRNFNSIGSFSLFWYCIYLLILYYPSILSFIWLSLHIRNKLLINHAEDDNCFILIWLARWKKWNEMNYKKEGPKID